MIVPVILSGGSGTRLWPLSRKLYPKQFLSLVSEKTLFQDTIIRLPEEATDPLVICNEEHRFIVAEQLRQIDSKNQGIILEPEGKNTAPAIAIAAFNSLNLGVNPTLLVLSADHLVQDNDEFIKSIRIAINVADNDKMVALGIQALKPETSYGYINADLSFKNQHYDIISFTEKPDLNTAEKLIESGKCFWNSGIFIFKASVYLKELKKYEPEIFNACKKSFHKATKDLDFIRINSKEFSKCPDKSVDYAVMEKTNKGIVVPYNGGWSDVGSWDTLWESKPKDLNNNVIEGDVKISKVENSFISSSSRLIAVNDISDIVIVDTQDALLVSSKNKPEDLRKIVLRLKDENRFESENHHKVYRPWGHYDSVDFGEGFQVKRILVNPGGKLSLQKHEKRSEHWVILRGIAKIRCGDKVFELNQNESTFIPKNEIHRLENNQNTPLEIIEVQTGSYLGEDDIIRLEDEYERK